jgi:urease accessory protein
MTVTFRTESSDPADSRHPARPGMQRAFGRSRVTFAVGGGRTRLADLWQEGCAKVRLPNVHDGGGPVAVLINTAGGITGGDVIDNEAGWADGATATVTSQAAERIYRRSDGVGTVRTRLSVGAGAWGAWLPQETIVFDRAGLDRSLDIEIAEDATFTACEQLVLGRTAMGERVRTLDLVDRWRIRRDGRLVFADTLRLKGDPVAILAGGATGGGAAAMATIVRAAPGVGSAIDAVRSRLDALDGSGVEAGASAFDGLVVVRLLARDGRALRNALEPTLQHLLGRPLPRVWAL